MGEMTGRERSDLAKIVRGRARLAKEETDTVAASREADFEAQLAKRYGRYHEAWQAAYEQAEQAVTELNERIRAEFEEGGVPVEFAPSAHMLWSSRGENGFAERRSELRKVAKTRIIADAKEAKSKIERASVRVQEQLIAAGLETEEAQRFLESMPRADELMPAAPTVDELEEAVGRRQRALYG
jgi:hypothetical protein